MSYQQLHAGKVKLNGISGIQHHLVDREKVKTNPNIDLSRSKLNHSIDNLQPVDTPHALRGCVASVLS